MAKQTIPSVADTSKKTSKQTKSVDKPAPKPAKPKKEYRPFEQRPISISNVEVPLVDLDKGDYWNKHSLSVTLKTELQKKTLARVRRGCTAASVRLLNGKLVQDDANSIKWLLEQIGTETENEDDESKDES